MRQSPLPSPAPAPPAPVPSPAAAPKSQSELDRVLAGMAAVALRTSTGPFGPSDQGQVAAAGIMQHQGGWKGRWPEYEYWTVVGGCSG